MHSDLLVVLLGVAIIVLLAHWVLKGSVAIARAAGWSHTFLGLIVLSVGTSIPELVAHVVGSARILTEPALRDPVSALVIGNNVGSDVFQQNFALPAIGLLVGFRVARRDLAMQMGALIAAAVLFWALALGGLSRADGMALVTAYAIYVYSARRWRWEAPIEVPAAGHGTRIPLVLVGIVAGLFVMALAADRVLIAAHHLAERLPISASLFGVVVLGVASALPELITSLVAGAEKHTDIAAGVLIGSNVTNPLLAVGVGAVISGYSIPEVVVVYDAPAKIATAVLLYIFLARQERLERWQCVVLIALFFGYVAMRATLFPADVALG